MSVRNVVIVGTGQAGFQTALFLRQEGYGGRILMLGEEPGLPYRRPPLSKTYLKDGKAEGLLLRNADFYAKNDIEVETETRIQAIDRMSRTATTERGSNYSFDHLVLATGARNRKLPISGLDGPNVLELRTHTHADDIRKRIADSTRIVVIGGGFIGLEFAAVAGELGKSVIVIEALPRLMARTVSAPVSEFFLRAHRNSGMDVRLGHAVTHAETVAGGKVSAVVLSNGERVGCDLVLVAVGVVPNCELAREAGLETADGIVVDQFLTTSDANISAVGDCVSFQMAGKRVRLESVQNAVDQARCVARRIVGSPEPYDALPWFWSDQGPYKLQIAGVVDATDTGVVSADDVGHRTSVFSFRNDSLAAVETVNSPGDHVAARKLLGSGRKVTCDQLTEANFHLRNLLTSLDAKGDA